ncbi:MAG: isoprenylcysteine carboxylmethyltransferase family protein [Chloroflexi bacterium]|nr:isoprenylcysteine carboxylmethyltransferase family protein [Chloroflexota bacterium]
MSARTAARTARRGGAGPWLRPFRLLAEVYHEIEDSSVWGRLVLANLWPAYIFLLPLLGKVYLVWTRLVSTSGSGVDPLHVRAQLVQDAATIVFFALVVGLYAIRAPRKGPRSDLRGAAVAIMGTFLLNLVGFLPVPAAEPTTEVLLVSTGVIVAGTGFTIWSLAALGRCFGMFPEARGLVTRGPYRWVRHPVYLGELVSGLGLVIVRPHPLVVLVYVLFCLFQYWRSRLEDAVLGAAFPAEYPEFHARTGRLLPRWR